MILKYFNDILLVFKNYCGVASTKYGLHKRSTSVSQVKETLCCHGLCSPGRKRIGSHVTCPEHLAETRSKSASLLSADM